MATAAEIAFVRDLIGEPDETNGWDDIRIGGFIDRSTSTRLAASDIWSVKATAYSKMVDISESGSSRKMSDLLKNALLLRDSLRGGDDGVVDPTAPRPRTRAITRP